MKRKQSFHSHLSAEATNGLYIDLYFHRFSLSVEIVLLGHNVSVDSWAVYTFLIGNSGMEVHYN